MTVGAACTHPHSLIVHVQAEGDAAVERLLRLTRDVGVGNVARLQRLLLVVQPAVHGAVADGLRVGGGWGTRWVVR